jgi:peptide/nickel transport system permease protein
MSSGGSVRIDPPVREESARAADSSRWRALARMTGGRQGLIAGGAIVAAWVVVALAAPLIAPYDPRLPAGSPLDGPGRRYMFGTDTLGFDVFSRVVYAPRVDLLLAAGGMLVALVIGTALGAAIGMARGIWADAPMRVFDALQAFPLLVLALALVAAVGQDDGAIIAAIALINVPLFLRVVRSQVVSLRERRFIEAARADGNPEWRILVRHIMPNTITPVVAQATNSIAFAVIVIASLSFLSVGVKPPTPEWGQMIQAGAQGIQSGQWWMSVFPGAALAALVLGFVLLGEGLQDVLRGERPT